MLYVPIGSLFFLLKIAPFTTRFSWHEIDSAVQKTYTNILRIFFDFSLTVKAAPHECVFRTGQP